MPAVVRMTGIVILTVASAGPALAQSAVVAGKLGYASEWDVTAKVTPQDAAGSREFVGPLTVRHSGVCAPGRPVEMTGEIRYRFSGWLNRRLDATLIFDGTACGFEGKLAQTYKGVLTCPQWRGVPLSLSLKT